MCIRDRPRPRPPRPRRFRPVLVPASCGCAPFACWDGRLAPQRRQLNREAQCEAWHRAAEHVHGVMAGTVDP
eukprot:9632187-Lingulodinium_polyedra.AAC.1